MPAIFLSTEEGVDFIFEKLGPVLRLATPLGLGKPNLFINEIFRRVAADSQKHLTVYTALSLTPPQSPNFLGQRFLSPFAERHWGAGYPSLLYAQAAARDELPPNVKVHEFYFQAGSALRSQHLQRHYQSVNYTYAAENIMRAGVNVVVQMIAARREGESWRYSLSCNPDLTLDVRELYKGQPLLIVGVVHPDLPFLEGEAEVSADFFEAIVHSAQAQYELFALPRLPISVEDHLIGLYASQLMPDEGTIQIGIGSLSDAIVSALRLRQLENALYRQVTERFKVMGAAVEPFSKGLYGLTEMLTDGYMHLRQAGILTRFVRDESSSINTYVHGSFFLGSKVFYEWLRCLSGEDLTGLRMTSVSKVNDLYDPNETLLRRQRVRARFFNTTMQVSLLGEAMSETLNSGKVVSGVGGQYNFVAMAHELKGARSILMLRSTRNEGRGRRVSNIVWQPGHVTIPRHLRDVVVTEYGVADLRGKSDEECIAAMIAIADSDFQDDLLAQAKTAGKIASDFAIAPQFRRNHAKELRGQLAPWASVFTPFPFGSDFTPVEENLALTLADLPDLALWDLLATFLKGFGGPSFSAELERMGLINTQGLKQRFYRHLLKGRLRQRLDNRKNFQSHD